MAKKKKKDSPAENAPPHPFTRSLEEPKLLAPSWMLTTQILKDGAIPFWDSQHNGIPPDDCHLPGIASLLGPYRWLYEFGASSELTQKITTLTEAEHLVEGERAGTEDKEMRRLLFREPPSLFNPKPEQIPSSSEVVFADSIVRKADRIDLPLPDTQLASLRKTAASPPPLLLVLNGLRSIREGLEAHKSVTVMAERYLEENGWRFDQPTRQLVATKEKHRGRSLLTLCMLALAEEFGRGARDATVRTKIKQYLSPIFLTELDDGRRGNIARALENLRRRRVTVKGR